MEPISAIPYLLQHTATMMLRQSDQVLQERLGIGMAQMRILAMLEHDPNARQRQLADRLGQTEASISRQIKLMAEKGYITVGLNPKSRREHRAVITPKGAKIIEAAEEVLALYHHPIDEILGEKERKALAETLVALHTHTCVPGKPFACDHPYGM
jgi:DNA-binding MarR family transcriptional regulator